MTIYSHPPHTRFTIHKSPVKTKPQLHATSTNSTTHLLSSASMSTCSFGYCRCDAATNVRNLSEYKKHGKSIRTCFLPIKNQISLSLFRKRLKVAHQIAKPEAVAGRLARVRWADALLRRADRLAALLLLLQPVHGLVKVKDNVRAIGEQQAVLPPAQALLDVLLQLLEEAGHVHHNTIAWNRGGKEERKEKKG